MGRSGSYSPMPPSKGTSREISKGKETGIGEGTNLCAKIQEELRVISPDPNVLTNLQVNDILDVNSTNGNAPIILVTSNGNVLGSIIPSSLEILLNCINEGNLFKAVIKSINKGICIVTISIK